VQRLRQACGAAVALVIAAALFGSPGVQAAERAPGLSKERGIPVAWQESIGGQLYSDWPRVLLFRGPFTKHPLWKGNAAALNTETWRCVNCHGWDYRGSAGVGGDLGVVPNVPGLRHLVGASRRTIVDGIRHQDHGFVADQLSSEALAYLVNFLIDGQRAVVDLAARARESGADVAAGGDRYRAVCQVCHGETGTQLNLGTERAPATLQILARTNPWKFLHGMRFGHAGVMPAFVLLEEGEFLNVLAYAAQSLDPD
jgi:thiosulfate dehydrogenase